MKKNVLYFLILIAAVSAVFFISREKKEEAKLPDDQAFAVEDTAAVQRIVLTNKNSKVDLRRENGGWIVNDKYAVMPDKIQILLETIKNVEVQYPVPKAQLNGVLKNMESATKVEIYGNERSPIKVYFVGGSTADSYGTYMALESEEKNFAKPYVTQLPGHKGIINVRYFTDETEWRDTEIFNYDPERIAEISVEYPSAPENSFRIKNENSQIEIFPLKENPTKAEIYQEALVKYISHFQFLNAEAFANDHPKKDSVLHEKPFAIIKVRDKNNDENELQVFKMRINRRSKLRFDEHGNEIQFDLDRYYGFVNNKDFVIIQDFVFGIIFRKYSDFLKREKEV